MADTQTAPATPAPTATPALVADADGYTAVTVQKTDDIGLMTYKRGWRGKVDAATLATMQAQGMI